MLIPVCPLVCLKALYENMLVELPFAGFFLSKLLGTSADVDIHHLASLDPEVYKNLLFLKSYEEDVEELGLNFTVVNNDLGEAQVSWGSFHPVCGTVFLLPPSPWQCPQLEKTFGGDLAATATQAFRLTPVLNIFAGTACPAWQSFPV